MEGVNRMENKISKVITLSDNSKHIILDQGNYNGKCYFLTSVLDKDDNLSNNFSILEETKNDGGWKVESVNDEKLLKALIDYFTNRLEKAIKENN